MRESNGRDRQRREERDEHKKAPPAPRTDTELPEIGGVNLNVDKDLMRLSGGP